MTREELKEQIDELLNECKILYFPNENATRSRIKSGRYENRLVKYGFSPENEHSHAVLLSNREIPEKINAVSDYFRLMTERAKQL